MCKVTFEDAIDKVNIVPITIETFEDGSIELTVDGEHTGAKEIAGAVLKTEKFTDDRGNELLPGVCPATGELCDQRCYDLGQFCSKSGRKLPGRPPVVIPELKVGKVNLNLEITYYKNGTLKIDVTKAD